METKIMNKENWSGEEGKYRFNSKRVIMDTNEYTYERVDKENGIWKVRSREHGYDVIWTVYEFDGVFLYSDMDLIREKQTIHELIAVLHWNLL